MEEQNVQPIKFSNPSTNKDDKTKEECSTRATNDLKQPNSRYGYVVEVEKKWPRSAVVITVIGSVLMLISIPFLIRMDAKCSGLGCLGKIGDALFALPLLIIGIPMFVTGLIIGVTTMYKAKSPPQFYTSYPPTKFKENDVISNANQEPLYGDNIPHLENER